MAKNLVMGVSPDGGGGCISGGGWLKDPVGGGILPVGGGVNDPDGAWKLPAGGEKFSGGWNSPCDG